MCLSANPNGILDQSIKLRKLFYRVIERDCFVISRLWKTLSMNMLSISNYDENNILLLNISQSLFIII